LRRQLQQSEPLRERLEAAIEHGDPGETRRIVARFVFSDSQRRHVERLIDDWEQRRDRRSGSAEPTVDRPPPTGSDRPTPLTVR
jgi:hypothetical protein